VGEAWLVEGEEGEVLYVSEVSGLSEGVRHAKIHV
jgi:hypothetical protein